LISFPLFPEIDLHDAFAQYVLKMLHNNYEEYYLKITYCGELPIILAETLKQD
jgi:hypothetical protein